MSGFNFSLPGSSGWKPGQNVTQGIDFLVDEATGAILGAVSSSDPQDTEYVLEEDLVDSTAANKSDGNFFDKMTPKNIAITVAIIVGAIIIYRTLSK